MQTFIIGKQLNFLTKLSPSNHIKEEFLLKTNISLDLRIFDLCEKCEDEMLHHGLNTGMFDLVKNLSEE